ncbi:Uma2 family endonuclease [Desulfofundulus thermocisternus]|uniref:Uma2 family endonuclease n=1 Tax=Desulfofundulus thermocisternus TaxID=42471 RepID=UPI00217E6668|nr:Uma2 family endonuclease [Desulfofundulus thermocisternus]MCS5696658.1 Uma2 family endonuclease [Desulfofundulus thermocisternus]
MTTQPAQKVKKFYTYDDYIKIDDGNRYELIEGELVLTPSPGTRHQLLVGRLFKIIDQYAQRTGSGQVFFAPLDVVLDEPVKMNTFQPDVIFISNERLGIIEETRINGAPDLVVEVLSPGTIRRDRGRKSRQYFKSGVREFWLVDPQERLVEVFVPGEKDWQRAGVYEEEDEEFITSTVLPGLEVKARDILGLP